MTSTDRKLLLEHLAHAKACTKRANQLQVSKLRFDDGESDRELLNNLIDAQTHTNAALEIILKG